MSELVAWLEERAAMASATADELERKLARELRKRDAIHKRKELATLTRQLDKLNKRLRELNAEIAELERPGK